MSRRSCPFCGTEVFSRSHRRGLLERILYLFLIVPVRCDGCNERFYIFPRTRLVRVDEPPEITNPHPHRPRKLA